MDHIKALPASHGFVISKYKRPLYIATSRQMANEAAQLYQGITGKTPLVIDNKNAKQNNLYNSINNSEAIITDYEALKLEYKIFEKDINIALQDIWNIEHVKNYTRTSYPMEYGEYAIKGNKIIIFTKHEISIDTDPNGLIERIIVNKEICNEVSLPSLTLKITRPIYTMLDAQYFDVLITQCALLRLSRETEYTVEQYILLDILNGHNRHDISKLALKDIYNTDITDRSQTFIMCTSQAAQKYIQQIYKSKNFCAIVCPIKQSFMAGNIIFAAEYDILGYQIQMISTKKVASINMQPGDYIMHEDYGVGIMKGMKILENSECITIEFLNQSYVYVPIYMMHKIKMHAPADAQNIQVSNLSEPAKWRSEKKKVQKYITAFSQEIVKLAKMRNEYKTQHIADDNIMMKFDEFCNDFQYQETEGQIQATNDILHDLEQGKIINRVIWGDTGFGKTEIAMRAIFLVISMGYQAVLIAPTTMLCRQHAISIRNRLKNVKKNANICEISRLKKDKITSSTDVIVTTTKNITASRIKLIIIDEEQHFGVQFKESIKQEYPYTHILIITATPIPRTVQLIKMGILDCTFIDTPPMIKGEINTHIIYDDDKLYNAVTYELSRGGQIFWVCPKISDIDDAYEKAQGMTDAKIAILHGRESNNKIQSTILDFIEGRIDIMISTNIVEAGVNVPNANTIIVYGSEMFGLAQLYQLRGRIGRGNRNGHAYLLLRSTSETAGRRMQFLQEAHSAGDNILIAEYDAQLRGGGNILGTEQKGHIKGIGISLYNHMMEQMMLQNTIVEIPTQTHIPSSYIADINQKFSVYNIINSAIHKGNLIAIVQHCKENFGPIPQAMVDLIDIAYIRIMARGMQSIVYAKNMIEIIINDDCNIDGAMMQALLSRFDGRVMGSKIVMPYTSVQHIKKFVIFWSKRVLCSESNSDSNIDSNNSNENNAVIKNTIADDI